MDPESKRARILRQVLDFINQGDWQEGEGFLIFGCEAYDKHLGIEYGDDEPTTSFDEFLRRMATEIKKLGGAEDIAKRISFSPVSRWGGDVDLSSFFRSLSQAECAHIASVISAVANDLTRNPKSEPGQIRDVSDDIDASLAADAIDHLEWSYRRMITFNEIRRPTIPFAGSDYFEEAHKCDLSGQKIAAAVLCRAVLEATLANVIDPSRRLKGEARTQQRSYIKAMLLEGQRLRLIDGSRVKKGVKIKDAGDAAIHNPIEFRQNWAAKVAEIIDDTRAIIEDLFSSVSRF